MPLRPGDVSFMNQLDRLRAAGVSVVSINVSFGQSSIEATVRMLSTFRDWIKSEPLNYQIANSVDDILSASAVGRMSIVFDIEGADALGGQLGLVSTYYDLGVKWLLLAYNRNNEYAGGCHDQDTGLTAKGRALVAEMASVGMVVCASHTGERSALEIIDASPNPVIFSHSNVLACCSHPRNISDPVIVECARRGGVIGLSGIDLFLGTTRSLVESLSAQIEYVTELVGIDHVGFGLDYVFDQQELQSWLAWPSTSFPPDGRYNELREMMPSTDIPRVLETLSAKGYRDEDLAKIAGENWLRVALAVWK
jgi:membrane dipeptidase